MTQETRPQRPSHIIGPDGEPLTLADLPSPSTRRWVIRRKAKVVAAVRGGLLSLDEACRRYHLSVEEFLSWQRMIERHGLPGLRVTRIQQYRGADSYRDPGSSSELREAGIDIAPDFSGRNRQERT